jgi:hypothetical protein
MDHIKHTQKTFIEYLVHENLTEEFMAIEIMTQTLLFSMFQRKYDKNNNCDVFII